VLAMYSFVYLTGRLSIQVLLVSSSMRRATYLPEPEMPVMRTMFSMARAARSVPFPGPGGRGRSGQEWRWRRSGAGSRAGLLRAFHDGQRLAFDEVAHGVDAAQ